MKDKSSLLKIEGYSIGDRSVGIYERGFSLELGLYPEDVSEEDREFIINNIIRTIWELHDNGDLKYNFSDEIKERDWDYTRKFSIKDTQIKLCDRCKIIQNL